MQTSGLVLDLYDDFRGETFRSIFPSRDVVPTFVKEGHALTSDERYRLPDDAFALVLVNEGDKLRKYACTDSSNTALSVMYFVKNAHKLPEVAQKVAAANLDKACGWYGLEPLAKEAGLADWAVKGAVNHAVSHPIDTALRLQQGHALVRGTGQEIKGRMGAIHDLERNGAGVVTPEQLSRSMGKHGEMTGTNIMPLQAPGNPAAAVANASKAVVNKTGSVGHLVSGGHGSDVPPGTNEASVTAKPPLHAPQAKALKPHVDVSNHEPPRALTEKKAAHHALGGHYPLDSYSQVSRAVSYFAEYQKHFTPDERREYCTNTVKRASALDIAIPEEVKKYASTEYAPLTEIKIALDGRRRILDDEGMLEVLTALEEKRASVDPEIFCETLKEFDKLAGLDHFYDVDIPDPYFSTFGFEKSAAEKEPEWSFIDGNMYMTSADLRLVTKTRASSLAQSFGADFVKELRKDPIGIFDSLPRDQKRMIAAMVGDNNPGADLNP